jgi:hypothetical protein
MPTFIIMLSEMLYMRILCGSNIDQHDMVADLFTKALSRIKHEKYGMQLGVKNI